MVEVTVQRSSIDDTHFWGIWDKMNQTHRIHLKILDAKNKVINCTLKVNLIEIDGIHDITKPAQIKKAYKSFSESNDFTTEPNPFDDETEFTNVVVKIYEKIRTSDYSVVKDAGVTELTPEMRAFLQQDCIWNIIDDVVRDYSVYATGKPMVYDWSALIEIFLTILSCKSKSPLNMQISGTSEIGKSFVTIRAANVFPNEMKRVINSASKTSLKYNFDSRDEQGRYIVDLEGKCFICLEKSEVKFLDQFKAVMSHDTYEVENIVSAKNAVGEIESRVYVYRGWPSFIYASVQHDDSREQTTRAIQVQPDSSDSKKKVAAEKFHEYRRNPRAIFRDKPNVQVLTDSLSWMKSYHCINPWSIVLDDMLQSWGRQLDKLYALIDSMTILHQLKRVKLSGQRDGNNIEVLLNSFEDVVIALAIFESGMTETEIGVTGLDLEIYRIMADMQSKRPPVACTHRNILSTLEAFGIKVQTEVDLTRHLQVLLNHALIGVRDAGRGNAPRSYEVPNTRNKYERKKLVPLFIEKCAEKIVEIEASLRKPVYRGVIYPDTVNDTGVTGTYLLDILLTQEYVHSKNKNTPIYHIFDPSYRDYIFDELHPILKSGKTYIEEHMKQEAIEEAKAEMIRAGKIINDEEMMERLAERVAEEQESAIELMQSYGKDAAEEIIAERVKSLERQMQQIQRQKKATK